MNIRIIRGSSADRFISKTKDGSRNENSFENQAGVIIMAYDLIPGYEFEVQLGMFITINFMKISNMSSAGEFDVRADGGNNERMFFSAKPHRTPDTLTFHKGWSSSLASMALSFLTPGLKIEGIMIMVKKDGKLKKSFYIEQGILTRVSFSDLDAMNSSIIIKTMEIAHTGLKENGI